VIDVQHLHLSELQKKDGSFKLAPVVKFADASYYLSEFPMFSAAIGGSLTAVNRSTFPSREFVGGASNSLASGIGEESATMRTGSVISLEGPAANFPNGVNLRRKADLAESGALKVA
jgi:hypothetical protein